MEIKEILAAIRTKLHIESLKSMQEEMLTITSKYVELSSPTGSGKTLAFIIYTLRHLTAPVGKIQSVIIVPSRELAIQVYDIIRKVATGYKTVVLYGGHSMEDEKNSLTPQPDIIISTPGRLLDHLNRDNLTVEQLRVLVLDEYDKSLELGFEKEMRSIVSRIGKSENIILTSATSSQELLPKWLPQDFTMMSFKSENNSFVEKIHIESPTADKADTLYDLLLALKRGTKTIVFVNHRESAERIYQFLKKRKLPVGLYHGALDQFDREKALTLFTNGTTPILIATDLAGRGLDIAEIESIVHYHLPQTQENWIHRNGRTARNGAKGQIYIITSEKDNIPDYIDWDREWHPNAPSPQAESFKSDISTLHINAGRKEKISKGDVVGFLINKGGLTNDEIGVIKLMDHDIFVGVPSSKISTVAASVAPHKLKNKKVRVTEVRI